MIQREEHPSAKFQRGEISTFEEACIWYPRQTEQELAISEETARKYKDLVPPSSESYDDYHRMKSDLAEAREKMIEHKKELLKAFAEHHESEHVRRVAQAALDRDFESLAI